MSAPRELLSHVSPWNPTRRSHFGKLFHPCLEVESDGPPHSAHDGSDGNIRCPRYGISRPALRPRLLRCCLGHVGMDLRPVFRRVPADPRRELVHTSVISPFARRRPAMSGGSAELELDYDDGEGADKGLQNSPRLGISWLCDAGHGGRRDRYPLDIGHVLRVIEAYD